MYQSRIKSFEDACNYEGIPSTLPDFSMLPAKHRKSLLAYAMIVIIAGALNKEANDGKAWTPKYDGSERHYFPYFYRGDDDGSGFRFVDSGHYFLFSSVGSRLEFISYDVSDYAGETFTDLYRDLHLMQEAIPATLAASE